ncbi:hypothetical protein D3C81_2219430 [compost metagenome]
MLLLTQDTRQRTGFKYGIDIIGGDVIFTHHWDLEQPENTVCQPIEEPHQRPEHH